ncbi:MAG: SDR family oxidoreductase [Cyclobacteriaceae bacterium]|nr:SDR family oxidoreductase [Cyclobacteriaceae bacterium]
MFSLKNKVAVVTGGGSGIGKAVAECFATQGATVCIIELSESAATETVKAIQQKGGKATAHVANVTNQHDMQEAFKKIEEQHSSVDILVNSAGIANVAKLETTSEADFEKIFQVNVKGTYNAMFAAIPFMKKQQRGVILNLASIASSVGLSDRFSYSMSKGAVVGMTLSVAKDYIKEGIRCNCISPARVHTPFVDGFIKANYPGKESEMFEKLSKTQPIGRMAKPEEIAYLALYLCSDEASFVTGCDYPIDGGFIRLNS